MLYTTYLEFSCPEATPEVFPIFRKAWLMVRAKVSTKLSITQAGTVTSHPVIMSFLGVLDSGQRHESTPNTSRVLSLKTKTGGKAVM